MISASEFQQAVGKRLQQLRLAMDKSQAELGDKLGVRGSAVSMYENGERALDPYDAFKLKIAYSAPLEWLYGGDESVIPAALAAKLKNTASAKRRAKAPPSIETPTPAKPAKPAKTAKSAKHAKRA